MNLGTLDRRTGILLGLGVLAVLVLRFGVFADREPGVVAANDSIPMAEKRLARLRQLAASVPGKEEVLKQSAAELAAREKGMLAAETVAQAQAQLLETARRVGKASGIDVRGAEELRAAALAADYGEVSVTLQFTCAIEQLVNFLAALSNEPTLVGTNEVQVSSTSPKDKTITVRLRLAGVVPRKLVPEKKGTASF